MNRLYILLLLIGLIVTNVFAESRKVSITKNMELPFWNEKSFNDLANSLEDTKWKIGSNENIIKLRGFFYYGKRKKGMTVKLDYTIVLDEQNSLKEMTIIDSSYKKGQLIKIHKWKYRSNKWSSGKWRSWEDYRSNPNKTYYKESTDRAKKFFKELVYPAIF